MQNIRFKRIIDLKHNKNNGRSKTKNGESEQWANEISGVQNVQRKHKLTSRCVGNGSSCSFCLCLCVLDAIL